VQVLRNTTKFRVKTADVATEREAVLLPEGKFRTLPFVW